MSCEWAMTHRAESSFGYRDTAEITQQLLLLESRLLTPSKDTGHLTPGTLHLAKRMLHLRGRALIAI